MLNAKTPRINEHALLKTIFVTAVKGELLDRTPAENGCESPSATSGSSQRSTSLRCWSRLSRAPTADG
jgi:hypothetical protein